MSVSTKRVVCCVTDTRTTIPIAVPPGTRVLRLERRPAVDDWYELGFWILWLHTSDFVHGTYLRLYDDGCIERITVRDDEGDDIQPIKGPDQ